MTLSIRPTFSKKILDAGNRSPHSIVCGRARQVSFTASGEVSPYKDWPHADEHTPDALVFPLGVNGILYPAGALRGTPVLDLELAQATCSGNDDVWFWACARMQGTPVVTLGSGILRTNAFLEGGTSLHAVNRLGGTDAAIKAAVELFDLRPLLDSGSR